MPDWARYSIEAGLTIGRTGAQERNRLAIIVPVRDYAAAFCAAGVALAVYERESSFDTAERFKALSELSDGAPLTLRDRPPGQRIRPGQLVGVRDDLGTGEPGLGVKVRVKGGDMIDWIPRPEIWRVTSDDGSGTTRPKRQRGWRLQEANTFAEDVLHPLDAARFTEPGDVRCLIVGSRRSIEAEVTQPGLATRSRVREGKPARGTLNDLLRLEGIAGVGGAHRTRVIPIHTKPPSDLQIPSVLVFDGANGYLKWPGRFRAAHTIIVLDRTEPRYADAVKHIHGDYVKRAPGSALPTLPPPPSGIEVLHFSQAGS